MINKIKDIARNIALNKIVCPYLNSEYSRYATIKSINYDSVPGTARITAILNGETREDEIHFTELKFTTEGDDTFLKVGAVSASRPWIEALAKDYLVKDPIKLPPGVSEIPVNLERSNSGMFDFM